MYINFTYKNGSNPYITTTNSNLFNMICKYDLEQVGAASFYVLAKREKFKKTYQSKRAILRDFAINWQSEFSSLIYSWGNLADWGAFFEEYGKKYGLLREFRENGII